LSIISAVRSTAMFGWFEACQDFDFPQEAVGQLLLIGKIGQSTSWLPPGRKARSGLVNFPFLLPRDAEDL